MKPYTVAVDIDLPRERVLELFDDPGNMPKWQTGLVSFEPLSGDPGQPGAKSKLIYENGSKRFELVETVVERNLPDEFNGYYEWPGGRNTLANRFIELESERTRWESSCSYEFSGLLMRVMATIMPGYFRKQNQIFMDNFKAFCEEGRDIRDG